MGVAWIMPEEVEDIMTDVQLSPSLAAVPKKNPETLLFTGDWRIIHDHNKGGSEPINNRTERTPGKRHPPTVFPQHHEVALLIVWMAVVLPRLRIAAGKLGTFMAFRNRLIHLMDANFFATQFPGDAVGAIRLTIIWGALTFGWTQSPSEYGVSGWAVSQAHRRSGPSADDLLSMPDVPHLNSTFVDDGVIIDFVDVGARAFSSTERFLVATQSVFSSRAPSWKKIQEEGLLEQMMMLWGFELDTTGPTAFEMYLSAPGPKREKAWTLLQMPEHAVGSRQVTIKAQQQLASYFQYLLAVESRLAPAVTTLWSFIATSTHGWVDPVGSSAEKKRAWLELDEARATLRQRGKRGSEAESRQCLRSVPSGSPHNAASEVQLSSGPFLRLDEAQHLVRPSRP